ncbi:MAG TPA: efflux RND transporter periplasmic adaptor subunit [Bryobacteraceae bacterium]|nr:efflux RND transporter periplasmic adaptor subunit [Bryobacteraceae bacterium]
MKSSRLLSATVFIASMTAGYKRESEEGNRVKKPADPAVVNRTAEGETTIRMNQAVQQRIGLQTAVVEQAYLEPQLIAYGRLEEDPSRTFTVRSPVAGTLQVTRGGSWPSIGQMITTGSAIGTVLPRIAPTDRVNLITQLANARSETDSAAAGVEAARTAYERARLLNADAKNVFDRVVEEARSKLETERARLEAARANVRTIENSLQSGGPANSIPLVSPSEGTVVETMAQPGESVEAGTPLLRTSRLDRLVARIDLPVGEALPVGAVTARIVPAGLEHEILIADRFAPASVTDPKAPGQAFLFRMRESRFGLRPGLAVTAYIPTAPSKRSGVTVPTSAVVRLSGKAYVYVQNASEQFIRTEIRTDTPVASGYFVAHPLAPGAHLVVTGAQTLLSEEFKPEGVAE